MFAYLPQSYTRAWPLPARCGFLRTGNPVVIWHQFGIKGAHRDRGGWVLACGCDGQLGCQSEFCHPTTEALPYVAQQPGGGCTVCARRLPASCLLPLNRLPPAAAERRMRIRIWLQTAVMGLLMLALGLNSAAADAEQGEQFFRSRIEPVLREHCYACHSHAARQMKGDLTLDARAGWETGGGSGPAIVPGQPAESLLLSALRYESLQMPPQQQLPDTVIADFERWIQMGAPDPRVLAPAAEGATDWWSLQPLRAPAVPETAAHPVDAFVLARLTAAGLTLSPPADRRTLLRRASIDLLGLPPTVDELLEFEQDLSPDAWERQVDRLLASPRYGERWARHWLDTVHFADSHGYEHDVGRDHAWRYRDYVIGALNQDTPWPRFIREQLAADVFYPEQTQLIPALGFLGAGTFDLSTYSTAPVTFAYLDRDDLVTQTMAAFVSTTANCARCHAHKFDPISQADYYSLQAVFAGIVRGDVEFDQDPTVARERRRWQDLQAAADQRDAAVLLSEESTALVEQWLADSGPPAAWHTLLPDTWLSTDGSALQRLPDGGLLSGGERPDKDNYLVTASLPLASVTAVRLDVLTHESLPLQGPGRQDNGNLHLSEIQLQVFEPGRAEPRSLAIRQATADFNQSGWGIERAIDGDPATAWGIHPAVSQPHVAVFELAEPLSATPDMHLSVLLKQAHGGGHLLGAFRLAVTADPPQQAAALPAAVAAALAVDPAARSQEQRLDVAAHALRQLAAAALSGLPEPAQVYAAATRVRIPVGNGQRQDATVAAPREVHVLQRGDFDKPREPAVPGALSALTHRPSRFELAANADEGARRAALADWLADPENVLTWRSVVNRAWHYHFGRGLVDTPSDFGRMGGVPSHPDLLDWLAVWFRDEAQGSLKQLHRLLLTSRVYCQSSQERPDAVVVDGDNRLLWRQQRQRLDADTVRDAVMAAAGTLDLTMGGPGVQHFRQSKGPQSTPTLDYSDWDWGQSGATRRSIYRFVWRGIADPFMEALDFPDLGLLTPARGTSVSALQSLALYNNDFMLFHSRALAARAAAEARGEADLSAQLQQAVRLVWLREPSAEELAELTEYAQRSGLSAACRVLLNSNEFLFVD